MKVLVPLVLLVVVMAGGACLADGSATPTPGSAATAAAPPAPSAAAPTPAPVTTADLDAMARRIFPGAHPASCGDMSTCPVTDRLRARVTELARPIAGQPGGVVQFCRCQNGADGMSVTSEVSGSGGLAHVSLHYGSNFATRIDLIFVEQPGSGLLLDDTQCTGRGPATSIYASPLASCSG